MVKFSQLILIIVYLMISIDNLSCNPVLLNADGSSNTYSLINSVLGGTAVEVPDCGHSTFGPHITQAFDPEISHFAFLFHIHATSDDDRCQTFDRQRNEIKTYNPSSDYLKGFRGETVSFSWWFKLQSGFQPSTRFTHIHQLKPVDGDESNPIITITPRKGSSSNTLQVIHVDSKGTLTYLKSEDLEKFLETWIHVTEVVTYDPNGKYTIVMRGIGGNILFAYDNPNIDTWRNETSYVRPKWGIYRSILEPENIRDEIVRFANFCLAKEPDTC